jgi:hypothetical protein
LGWAKTINDRKTRDKVEINFLMYQNFRIRRAKVTELVDKGMTITTKGTFALQMEAFNGSNHISW